ncbi:septal ring lytic transglycosylase RlpA family protein [Parvularcula sp. LCG005]|uniref:septal ring lytic transglycosylase RlpA family protein n=1 Tax=Parvularcula sp. LCG005 TaxID=3078805 RepID=UPI00294229FF|nr:septal ring lytic transglycosylase RlpA family protein [Parvularcula sp. LCG005]WOI54793.1 septal ring lytic transglycosylase RlpA family protein [Parvularcula sp. LCG005]
MVHPSFRRLCAVLLLLGLAACSSTGSKMPGPFGQPNVTPNPHVKVGTPYVIAGRTYYPKAVPIGTVSQGTASWYGPKFHGRLTANGELFDQDRLSAAHKTLPLPSLVRVTNLENGRSAVLRLNDRGPYAHEREIDLSKGAAEKLGMREKGLARVQVEYLGPANLSDAIVRVGEPENYAALQAPVISAPAPQPTMTYAEAAPVRLPPLPTVAPRFEEPIAVVREPTLVAAAPTTSPAVRSQAYFVQIGAFTSRDNVDAARARLPEVIPVHVSTTPSAMHLVRLGPYTHEFAAEEAAKVAVERGFVDARIVQELEAE